MNSEYQENIIYNVFFRQFKYIFSDVPIDAARETTQYNIITTDFSYLCDEYTKKFTKITINIAYLYTVCESCLKDLIINEKSIIIVLLKLLEVI